MGGRHEHPATGVDGLTGVAPAAHLPAELGESQVRQPVELGGGEGHERQPYCPTCNRTRVRYGRGMGWRNPPVTWSELEGRLSDQWATPLDQSHWPVPTGATARPGPASGTRTRPSALERRRAADALRRAALPLQLQLPRRRLPPRGAGRGGGPARPRGPGPHRPRRLLRRGPLRRGGPGLRAAHRLRRRADPGRDRAAQKGEARPRGRPPLVLARDPTGYARLAGAISRAQMAGEKGAPRTLAGRAGGRATGGPGHWLVLTGCRKGAVPRALVERGPAAARRELARLVEAFGRENVAVELWDHGDPLDSARNDALAELAVRAGGRRGGHQQRPLRHARPAAGWPPPWPRCGPAARSTRSTAGCPAAAGAHLRSGAEQARRFARYPGVVERAAELGRELRLRPPAWSPPTCPRSRARPGHDEMSYLRELTELGRRPPLRPRPDHGSGRVTATRTRAEAYADRPRAGRHRAARLPRLLPHRLGHRRVLPQRDIYCQGRGRAANSAVCYALGITNADAVGLGLLFERFLSPERDGPPDIDLDIESDRREEAIQYVYERYGREHAAQVANVITYRARSAVRDMAKALGYAPGQQDAWSKQIDRWSRVADSEHQRGPDGEVDHDIPAEVLGPGRRGRALPPPPRHPLGRHGHLRPAGGRGVPGRVGPHGGPQRPAVGQGRLRRRRPGEVRPARPGDALGPALRRRPHPRAPRRRRRPGHHPPGGRRVYDMLCEADSVGVFQVESRAQMATLPRLRPRTFYDLVVEVALIRPGPIQGGSVHPYIRRRNGQEPVTYLHPLLENVAGEDPRRAAVPGAAHADGHRRGRLHRRPRPTSCARPWGRSAAGSAWSGCGAGSTTAWPSGGSRARWPTQIWEKLAAFANFGFPESHSVSLRLPRLRLVVDQALLPGRLLRRPAQRPAHGLLLAALAGAGRPPPRRRGPHPRRQRLAPPRPRSSRAVRSQWPSESARY